jgi:hypothetical protein
MHSGVPFTSQKFLFAHCADHVQAVTACVRQKYNLPFFFLNGLYLAIAYGLEDGAGNGMTLVSHTCDPSAANRRLDETIQRRLYLSFIVRKILYILKKNMFWRLNFRKL